jgi:hypothetical protein
MKHRKVVLTAVIGMMALALVAAPVLAGHHEGMGGSAGKSCPMMKKGCDKSGMGQKQCGMGQKQCGMSGDRSSGKSGCPIVTKVCKKACWMMAHKEDLALTDDQMSKIKVIEMDAQKSSIRGMAEMKVFGLELESHMSQSPVNVEAIESMIDSGMAGMATSAKAAVKAYAELQTILTDDQITKAKELKKTDCSSHAHSA